MSCCVLIAGLPASGKTTFAAHLAAQLQLPMVSKDRIKEIMYDTIGFRSKDEKVTLSIAATQLLYYYAESMMRTGMSFILENNFENVQKPGLLRLLEEYRYRTVTIRFGGDVRVIYERYLKRDSSPERHGGHKTSDAWPRRHQENLLAAPPTMEEFVAEVSTRGIAEFSVGGEELFVDATDFDRLSYVEITKQVQLLMLGLG